MKKRIKVITKSDGDVKYIPQIKSFRINLKHAYSDTNMAKIILVTIFSLGIVHLLIFITCSLWLDHGEYSLKNNAEDKLDRLIRKYAKKPKITKKVTYINFEP